MKKHVVVCGMGLVGYRVTHLLRRLGEPVAVVTQGGREDWIEEVRALGAILVTGDARDPARLVEAGIRDARALIIATGQDLVNIEVVLDAKLLCPDLPIVVRLFDQALARQFEANFGVRRALGMSALAAPSFVAAALGERVIASFPVDAALFVVGQLPAEGETQARQGLAELAVLAPDRDAAIWMGPAAAWERLTPVQTSGTSARSVRQWLRGLRDWGEHVSPAVVVRFARQVWRGAPLTLRAAFAVLNLLILLSVFVFRYAMHLSFVDALYFIITTVTTTGYGDITPRGAAVPLKLYGCMVMILGSATIATLYALLTDFIVTARFEQMLGRQRIPHENHTIVVGLGNVGFRIVEELQRAGTPVVAIERDNDGEFVGEVRAQTPVVIGDARLPQTLLKANLPRAHALIAATSDDAVNLSIGLTAEEMRPAVRTVLRLFDADFARKVQTALNIDAALSASRIAAPTFVAAALYDGVAGAFVLDDCLYIVVRCPVGDTWHGQMPDALGDRHGGRVLMRKSPESSHYIPATDKLDALHRDETVLVLIERELSN